MSNKLNELILAGALGDAFGYPVEFASWQDIEKAYEGPLRKLIVRKDGKAVATDDTQMTLFACEGIIKTLRQTNRDVKDFVYHARLAFLDWYKTQISSDPKLDSSMFNNETLLFAQRAPGVTCLGSLNRNAAGTCLAPDNDSKGCGAVMRSAPYGFLVGLLSNEDIWEVAAQSGALTHGHPEGWGSGAAMAYMVAKMLEGNDLRTAVFETEIMCMKKNIHNTAWLLKKAYSTKVVEPDAMCDILGEGWVGDEALAISVWAALNSTNVFDAIMLATNHRGDSDSTASIAAQLASLQYGLSNIESELALVNVDLGPLALKVASELHAELVNGVVSL